MASIKITPKKTNASDMLFLAVMAYLCLLIEPVLHYLIVWTPLIDYVPIGDMWWTLILRVSCCALWTVAALIVIKCSRGCGFDPVGDTKNVTKLQWAMLGGCALLFTVLIVVLDGGIKETVDRLIDDGNLVYIVSRLIFEAFQVAVMVLVLSLGQKWGDLLLKKENKYIPFGGIVLGVCMMLMNLITGGFSIVALMVLGIQLFNGMVFLLAGKKALIAAPFIYFVFVIM